MIGCSRRETANKARIEQAMTKKDIHQRFVDQLARELESIAAAARKSFATATNEEHHAEGKYDTFKLESPTLPGDRRSAWRS
jgi:hypothetical protein